MRFIGYALLGLLLGTSSSVADSPALQLTLTVLNSPVKLGQGIVVRVTTINEGNQPVTYHNTNPICNYSFKVLNSAGEEVPETDLKRQLSCAGGQQQISGRNIVVTLKPGDSNSEDLRLTEQYKFTQPGDYSIQVDRTFPRIGEVSSNAVSLSVTSP